MGTRRSPIRTRGLDTKVLKGLGSMIIYFLRIYFQRGGKKVEIRFFVTNLRKKECHCGCAHVRIIILKKVGEKSEKIIDRCSSLNVMTGSHRQTT